MTHPIAPRPGPGLPLRAAAVAATPDGATARSVAAMGGGLSMMPATAGPAAALSPLAAALRHQDGPPPMDSERVATLRDRIASGQYARDADAIAAALLAPTGPRP